MGFELNITRGAGLIAAIALVAGILILPAEKTHAGPGLFPYEDAVAVAAGKVLYGDFCAACHGLELEGEPNWQSQDADGFMPAPPHDETGHTWHHADTLLYMITKFGTGHVVGEGYQTNMMGFTDVLSDEEILQTLAYIKSTWPPRLIEMHNTVNENATFGN